MSEGYQIAGALRDRFRRVVLLLWTARAGRAVGGVLFLSAMAMHRSQHASIVGRWSMIYTFVLASLGVLVAVLCGSCFRSGRRTAVARRDPSLRLHAAWMDAGLAAFGMAYLLEALHDRRLAARALDLNLFGALSADAVVLSWLASVCLVVAAFAVSRRFLARAGGPAVLIGALAASFLLLEGAARAVALLAPEIQVSPPIEV